MSRVRNGLLAVAGGLLLTVLGCAGLSCSGVVGVGWWATTPRGQHFPSAVIVEQCDGAVWYRDGDDRLASEMAVRMLLAEMARDGEFEENPRWLAEALFHGFTPQEAAGCLIVPKRWVGAMNPATLPALWAPIASRVLDEQDTFEVEGHRFARGEDQIWGMVDGTLVMASDEEALVPAVQALVAEDPPTPPLRKQVAQLVVQGDLAFVVLEAEPGGDSGTGWIAVDSPDKVRVQTTKNAKSTEEGTAEAQRMCDEVKESVPTAEVDCETTWLDGMHVQLDIEVTGLDAALALREAGGE